MAGRDILAALVFRVAGSRYARVSLRSSGALDHRWEVPPAIGDRHSTIGLHRWSSGRRGVSRVGCIETTEIRDILAALV
ncbi:hypothetical protein, partial [Gordonia effusa]|uniref:hypothetical protein n=1 Tax=Gordonia effusa TaxID=263908 RepID=UPI0005914E6B